MHLAVHCQLRHLGLVLLLPAALLVLTACRSVPPTVTPTPTPTPTLVPITPSVQPTPAGPTSVRDERLHTYYDPGHGFVVTYPRVWKEAEPRPGETAVFDGPGGSPRLSVQVVPEDADLSLEERMDSAVERLREAWAGLEVVGRERAALDDGAPSLQAGLRYTRSGRTWEARAMVVDGGAQTYVVVAAAPEAAFDAAAPQLQRALTSFQLFEPTPEGVPADRALFMAGLDPLTLDPAMSRETRSHGYVAQLFSGLVSIDEDLRIRPELAEGWSVKDGTVFTFTLREGILFHDGTPITADDFKYSIERASDPALGSPTVKAYLGDILGVVDKLEGRATRVRGVEVLGPRSLRITIDAPKAYFLAKLTYPTAAVVNRASVEGGGEEWWRSPNGSGPFMLREWREGELLVLERHQEHLPRPSKLEFAVFRILQGVPMRTYEAGTIDVAPVFGPDVDRALDPENQFLDELTIFPLLHVAYLGFNVRKPPFDDPQVRQAFAMTVDRQRLADVVFFERVDPATGILPPGMPAYSPDLAGIPFDPQGARRLLQESSYGSPEALPPIVFSALGLGTLSNDLAFLLEGWRQHLGVEVQVRQLTSQAYYYRLSEELDNLYDTGWVADYPDPENFLDLLFHSVASLENNPGRYSNGQVDRLLVEARAEENVERRMGLYREAEQLLVDDTAAIPLYHDREYMLIRPYVQGYVYSPLGIPVLRSVELLPRGD